MVGRGGGGRGGGVVKGIAMAGRGMVMRGFRVRSEARAGNGKCTVCFASAGQLGLPLCPIAVEDKAESRGEGT